MKKLVIVESPAKTKTIAAYLGSDYDVQSSKGHIRDLATTGKFGLGVDVEGEFEPNYIPIKGKSKTITELKKAAKNAECVYLATDPDREGEAISWHLYDALGLTEKNYQRVVFNEITKPVVRQAFENTRKIDDNLVKSQETRRIFDRIIGFRLSKLMQSKTGGKSAGRVQSVALKLIVDREREINAFNEEEYWTIKGLFENFDAELEKYHNKKIEINNEVEADEILSKLSKAFKIEDVTTKEVSKQAPKPFKTSTLQQTASSKLNYAPKKTMSVAQKLYEGIDLEDETVGLITYMRTDSIRLSPSFIDETFKYIKANYGDEYLGYVKKEKNTENVQDAHEGIRPTSIKRTPSKVKAYLSADEFKLYSLIYYRALASLMANVKKDQTSVVLENNDYLFKTTGSVLKFNGYLKVYEGYEKNEDTILPDFSSYKSDVVVADEIVKDQHFTKPPARFSESTLIKELESLKIGRPSTYATIMDTIKTRSYVKLEDKKLYPTEIGIETTDKLQEFFSSIVNVEYTASMENKLDEIAEAEINNIEVLKEFYNSFEPLVQEAFENMEKKEAEETGESCPECGSPLVVRRGRYGEFVACSNYPECKYIKKEEQKIIEVMDCPKCEGKVVEKKTRKGKIFWGCSNYPKCDFASWYKPLKKCSNCKSVIVEKKDGNSCLECDSKE